MAELRAVFLGCSVNVETQDKRRVLLHNPSMHHILSVLHSIMLSSYLEDVKRKTYKNIKSKH